MNYVLVTLYSLGCSSFQFLKNERIFYFWQFQIHSDFFSISVSIQSFKFIFIYQLYVAVVLSVFDRKMHKKGFAVIDVVHNYYTVVVPVQCSALYAFQYRQENAWRKTWDIGTFLTLAQIYVNSKNSHALKGPWSSSKSIIMIHYPKQKRKNLKSF